MQNWSKLYKTPIFLWRKEKNMFWLGMLTGFILGGNMGVICMALFKSNK
jgi:hypothetical protein